MPTITMQDGAKITLPDGATDEQIQEAAEDYAASLNAAPEGAASSLSPEQLDKMLPVNKPTNMGAMPNGAPLPYGMDPKLIEAQNQSNAQENHRNAEIRSQPSMIDKIAAADKEGWIKGIGKGILDTANEFGQGAEDLVDKYLPAPISNVLNYRPFGENGLTPDQRIERRKGEMQESNDDKLIRSIANPVSTTVGNMLPYIATGMAGERAIDAVSSIVSPITKRLAMKGLDKVAPSYASHIREKPPVTGDFMTRTGYMAKAPIIGGAEGAVNYNQNSTEGALFSFGGAGLGMIGPLGRLSRVENIRDDAQRATINDMYEKGFSITPGVRTGNTAMQTEEAGIRNSDTFGPYYHQNVTRPNQQKITEMVGDTMGLNGKNRDSWSQAELDSHLNSLSSEYKALEANTTGVIGRPQAKAMADAMNELKPTASKNTTTRDQQNYNQIRSVVQQIQAETNKLYVAGAPTMRQFDGAKYQQLRQRIQSEASDAYRNGNTRLGDGLKKIQAALDDSLQAGMDKATAANWKDLNERYAMTNLVMKHGMTPNGMIDPQRISHKVMQGDEAIRTLTGRGGRIKKLQDVARYNDILNNVEGGSLTGLGSADYGADRALVKAPWKYRLPLAPRARVAYRLSQAPTWGLGPTAGAQVGRAFSQTEPADKAYEAAKMSVEGLIKKLMGDQ